jgi:hypothetical protein
MLIAFPCNSPNIDRKFAHAGKNISVKHVNERLLEYGRYGLMQVPMAWGIQGGSKMPSGRPVNSMIRGTLNG